MGDCASGTAGGGKRGCNIFGPRQRKVGSIVLVFLSVQTEGVTQVKHQKEDTPVVKGWKLISIMMSCRYSVFQANYVWEQRVGRKLPAGAACAHHLVLSCHGGWVLGSMDSGLQRSRFQGDRR